MKTTMVVNELARIAPETSFVPFMQASLISPIPDSILENMFSKTTKELSKTIPTAKLIPARLTRLIVLPRVSKIIKELIMLVGMAIARTNVVLKDFKNNKRIQNLPSLEKCLKNQPDIGLVCNTSSLHVETAIKLAKNNCHLLIEKPLSNSFYSSAVIEKYLLKEKFPVLVNLPNIYSETFGPVSKFINNNKNIQIFILYLQFGLTFKLFCI